MTITAPSAPYTYGPGIGGYYMDHQSLRCGRCDARYCWDGCYAGAPGYVYAVGHGYVPFAEGAKIEAEWAARGLVKGTDYGIEHGSRRVEWDTAVPAEDDATDAIRLAALAA